MAEELMVGTAEVDITPPVGTPLCGSFSPRESEGIEDPLLAKAMVLESGGRKLSYVILDLLALSRETADRGIALASEQTEIPAEQIVWAATHTHTGPYTDHMFGLESGLVNEEWLATVPGKLAEAVATAHSSLEPAKMYRLRGYQNDIPYNRRLRFKDGRELNTWLLGRGEEGVQCLGAAAVVDPEIGILAFENLRGELISVLFQYTLHTNTNFGRHFSGDYPAVVAARLRERFGPELTTLFVPGAFADVNTRLKHRAVGDALADQIIDKLNGRGAAADDTSLESMKRNITVPYRDFSVDQEERIRSSQWGPAEADALRKEAEIMRRRGMTEQETVLQAWRIGEAAFVSLPGELFVQWGIRIKEQSPFPWTYPVELGGDYLGYLVTHQAWKAGGYESLIARSAKPSPEGVEMMVDAALDMLRELWKQYEQE